MTAPAFNVVRGVMVLEEPAGLRFTPFHAKREAVAARVTNPTCRYCGHENGAHGLVGTVLCRNWRPFGTATIREQFERSVARIVGRRDENTEALAATLKEALS